MIPFTENPACSRSNGLCPKVKIVLAEDHARFRQFVKACLECMDDLEVVGEAADGIELLELLQTLRPDLIILDITMPRLQGLEAARKIKARYPHIKILILTMHNSKEYLHEALAAGAEGFLLKERSDLELATAVRRVLQGETYITPLMTGTPLR